MIQTAVRAPITNAPRVSTITTQNGPHQSVIKSFNTMPNRYMGGFYPPHG
jgi:hypothetical protein